MQETTDDLADITTKLDTEIKHRVALAEKTETSMKDSNAKIAEHTSILGQKAEKVALEDAIKTQKEQQSEIDKLKDIVKKYEGQLRSQEQRFDAMEKSMGERIQSNIQEALKKILPRGPSPEEEDDADKGGSAQEADLNDDSGFVSHSESNAADSDASPVATAPTEQVEGESSDSEGSDVISEEAREPGDQLSEQAVEDSDDADSSDALESDQEHPGSIGVYCDEDGYAIRMTLEQVCEIVKEGDYLFGKRIQEQETEHWFYVSHVHQWSSCRVIIITRAYTRIAVPALDDDDDDDDLAKLIEVDLYAGMPEVRIEAARRCLEDQTLDVFESRLSKLQNTPTEDVCLEQYHDRVLWDKAVDKLVGDAPQAGPQMGAQS